MNVPKTKARNPFLTLSSTCELRIRRQEMAKNTKVSLTSGMMIAAPTYGFNPAPMQYFVGPSSTTLIPCVVVKPPAMTESQSMPKKRETQMLRSYIARTRKKKRRVLEARATVNIHANPCSKFSQFPVDAAGDRWWVIITIYDDMILRRTFENRTSKNVTQVR